MIREAGMLESRSYEGPQKATDIHGFLDGFAFATLEDFTGLGDLPVPRKVFSSPVGVGSYLRCLVTKEYQAVMNEVETPCLFNEAQQALNQASLLHHEAFLRYREELTHHEAEVRDLTEKSDSYKLLSEKLQADLVTARDEHAEMFEQVRQRLEQIGQLKTEVDTIQVEAEEFKKNMDILASRKEAVRA
ncbi:PREDICTED: uncharacterized protein LOC109238608 [Nicotiana attenuata]|uniref:uncharacterized protein LOC109238608 n=1 Tax=Nicotiana attenuata TaxID=49451 RepID=UPI0009052A2E|nr:PREDICTED: uncharacterized protein LOC109238608 [Nicotiana attenuata]